MNHTLKRFLYLSIGQPGYPGSKGEKGISIKGEQGTLGRPGYIWNYNEFHLFEFKIYFVLIVID